MEFRDQIAHEISSLETFVDYVAAPCLRISRSVAFIDASERFFHYISDLARTTFHHLRSLPLESMSGDDFDNNRQQLLTIRDAWKDLHPFIRPATAADTLRMPLALLQSLVRRVHEIKEFSSIEFVLFHTDEFNYLQVKPTMFRLIVNKVALALGGRDFDRDIALIGMPSSQSPALFMNCLLAHEIGHFAYDRKSLLGMIKAEAEQAVKLEKVSPNDLDQNVTVEIIAKWAEELFCDLFAVMLLGPCYVFAYVELFDLVNLVTREGSLSEPKLEKRVPFYWEHPSHIFRVQQQTQLLRSIGWWDQIKHNDSRYIKLMDQLLTVDLNQYRDPDPRKQVAIQAFHKILPEIHRSVGECVDGLDPGVHDYALLQSHVREYLRNGVVPSTVVVKDGSGGINTIHPTEITTINAGFVFYLEEIGNLMQDFGGATSDNILRRKHWMNKIEDWIAKALGDLQLISEKME
jgi:hypothetical protein